MSRVRKHLLNQGMSANFADHLAAKYIKNQEESSDIFILMDFF